MSNSIIPIFIGGCPRSGTTMLGDLLSKHSEIGFTPELNFKLPLFKKISSKDIDPKPNELLDIVKKHPKAKSNNFNVTLKENDLIGFDKYTMSRLITNNVINNYLLSDKNVRFIADHTPSNLKIALALAKSYPESLFIHIVRDGRAVFNSVKKVTWGPNIPTDASTWWLSELSFGFLAEVTGISIIRIHYEDLVINPKNELDKIFDYLELDRKYKITDNVNKIIPNYSKKQHMLVGQIPKISRIDNWKKELSEREIELFEISSNVMLSNLGYNLMCKKNRSISRIENIKYRLIDVYFKIINLRKQKKKISS